MFGQKLNKETLEEILGKEALAEIMKQKGCAECDDPECPLSRVNVVVVKKESIMIEPGVTDLGQFPDEILVVMVEGLDHGIADLTEKIKDIESVLEVADLAMKLADGRTLPNHLEREKSEIVEEAAEWQEMLTSLLDLREQVIAEKARTIAEMNRRKTVPTVEAMIKAINKTHGKSQSTSDYPGNIYEPTVVLENNTALVKLTMPEANNDWANKTWNWAQAFIKRFGGWISFVNAGREAGSLYIAVKDISIQEWIELHKED